MKVRKKSLHPLLDKSTVYLGEIERGRVLATRWDGRGKAEVKAEKGFRKYWKRGSSIKVWEGSGWERPFDTTGVCEGNLKGDERKPFVQAVNGLREPFTNSLALGETLQNKRARAKAGDVQQVRSEVQKKFGVWEGGKELLQDAEGTTI